jgi:hypothetical protein
MLLCSVLCSQLVVLCFHLHMEEFHTLLKLLPAGVVAHRLGRHGIQHKLGLWRGLWWCFSLWCHGDHTLNLANQGWIYRRICSMNDFALQFLNQPPSAILRQDQRTTYLVPRQAEDRLSLIPPMIPLCYWRRGGNVRYLIDGRSPVTALPRKE